MIVLCQLNQKVGGKLFSDTVRSVLQHYGQTRSSHGGIDFHTAGHLLSLIEATKPVNLVEIGVASGASTCLILRLLEKMNSTAVLSSFDIGRTVFQAPDMAIGHLVRETFPEGTPAWRLNTGMMSSDVARTIEGKADFVFIDANHEHPWPAIDTLMAISFTKPGCLILHHDINLPRIRPEFDSWGAAHLYDEWPGHKQSYPTDSLATSGAIVLNKSASKNAEILMDIIEGHPSEGKIPPVLQRKLVDAAGTFLKGKTLQRFTKIIDSLG